MNRKSGFYWVSPKEIVGWRVAFWSNIYKYWQLTGKTEKFYDNDFKAINEVEIDAPI